MIHVSAPLKYDIALTHVLYTVFHNFRTEDPQVIVVMLFNRSVKTFVHLIKLIFVKQCFARFDARRFKGEVKNLLKFLMNHSIILISANFLQFLPIYSKLHDNNIMSAVNMKRRIPRQCFECNYCYVQD